MARGNRWIDEDWARDWLLWTGVATATAAVAVSVALHRVPWWRDLFVGLWTFAVVVAIVGFVRTAVRAYREPRQ